MSLITPAEVIALTGSTLLTAVIQGVIDREEAGLSAPAPIGIGQLEGERTEVLMLTTNLSRETLTIQRTTDSVEVIDNGDAVAAEDIRILADQRTLLRFSTGDDDPYVRGYWVGPVEVTYTPNDLERVRRVLIEIVGIGIAAASGAASAGDIVSETTGSYSYTRGRTATQNMTSGQQRRALIASLLPQQLPSTMHVRSSVIGRRGLLGTVRPL